MSAFSIYVPSSLATDGFESPILKLPHSPTICAIEPTQDTNFTKLGDKMLSETEYAVLDWKTKLNQGQSRHSTWNMTLIKIPLDQQNGFDYSKCDITINYEPKPKDPNLQLREVGVTYPNATSGKAKIIIYYLGVNWDIKYSSWNSGNIHYTQYTPVIQFTGFLASDPQLQETIRHELGHSFGLGHYIVSDETLYDINMGKRDPPSIMLQSEMTYGVNHYDITPADINEIKLIYGVNGFGMYKPTQSLTAQDIRLPSYDTLLAELKSKSLPIPTCPSNSINSKLVLPQWTGKIIKLWSDGAITDQSASNAMMYARQCIANN
ncbi:MAG: hypothetical protein KGH95_05425 [Thaumarchaeota archaeon]|nr:hypothetical protein [Nitrososphaerota archaeon]